MKKVHPGMLLLSMLLFFMASCTKQTDQVAHSKPANTVKPSLYCLDCEEQPTDEPGGGSYSDWGHYYNGSGSTSITTSHIVMYDDLLASGSAFWQTAYASGINASANFTVFGWPVNTGCNDRGQSVTFSGIPAGYSFEAYDDGDYSKSDDWWEILFKANIPTAATYVVGNFERSWEDAYVKVVYHKVDNLNGHVSAWVANQ